MFWAERPHLSLLQVDLGRPGGHRQSGGGCNAAAMTDWMPFICPTPALKH